VAELFGIEEDEVGDEKDTSPPEPPATLAELFGTAEDEVEDEDTGEHKEMGNGDGSVGSEEQSGKRPRLE
jgi:hypothetical protein